MTECADGTPEETPHDGDDDPDPAAQGSTGAGTDIVDEQLAAQLVAQARAQGISLVGPDGLLQRMTKLVVEGALEGELTDHLGYQHGDPVGRNGGNSRNGTRAKTVLTEVGPVELEVPRDRDASFQPQIVRKRQRRLGGVEDLVVSLVAKGLTTGEVQAHLAEIYGAEVSRQTISVITDRVLEGLGAWQSRPLDPVYPVIFIDAIQVKLRDGQVANRPIYVALAVTCDGERDILGLWAGDGGEGAKTGCTCSLRSKTAAWPMCASWSATACKACQTPSARCGRRRSPRPASCICCATACATPPAGTGPPSQGTFGRSTPRRPKRPRWRRWQASPRPCRPAIRPSSGCGSMPGPSSSPSWPSTPRSARSSPPPTPSRASTRGSAARSRPAGTSPTSRPRSSTCI